MISRKFAADINPSLRMLSYSLKYLRIHRFERFGFGREF